MGAYADFLKRKNIEPESESESTGGFGSTTDYGALVESARKKKRKKQDPTLKLPKGTDREKLMLDYYVPDQQEQLAEKAKAAKTVPLLLDVLDNFQRLSYGLLAGEKALAESIRYGDPISNVHKRVWKGLKREEKTSLRAVANIMAPDAMREAEDATAFKVFGVDVSPVGIGLFAGEVIQDPFNILLAWMPTHYLTKAGKLAFGASTKATRAVGTSFLGAERVEKIIAKGADIWYEKIAPLTDIASIFNRTYGKMTDKFSPGKRLKRYFQQVESAPHLTRKEIKAAMRVTDANGKVGRLVNMPETASMFDTSHSISDEMTEIYGDLRAHKLGMDIEDMLTFNKVKKVLDDLSAKDALSIPKETMDFFEKSVAGMKKGGARKMTELLLEERAIGNVVKRVVKGERTATEILAKLRLNVSNAVYDEAISMKKSQLGAIQKSLGSDTGVVMDLIKNDVDTSSKVLRAFYGDLKELMATGTPEALAKVRARFNVLKSDLSQVTRYGIDETKLTLKSDMKFRKIGSLVRLIGTEVGELGGKLAAEAQSDIAKLLSKHMGMLDGEIKGLGNVIAGEFKAMQRTVGAVKGLTGEIASRFNTRSSELMKDISKLGKYRADERKAFDLFLRKADKFEVKQAIKYKRNLKAINSGALDQEIMMQMKIRQAGIVEKHLKGLDPSLHRAFHETRRILDEQGTRLRKAGLTTGVSLYYTPRQIAKEFQDQFSKVLPHLRTNMGFLRSREFRLNREFTEWVVKNGGKVENDLALMMLEDVTNARIKIARTTLMDGLISDFGSQENIPRGMMKGLDFLFGGWKSKFPPLVQRVMGAYGKAMNITKFMLTGPNPGFTGRNILSSVFQMQTSAGVLESINPGNWFNAIKIKFGGKGTIKTVEGVKTFDQIRDFMDTSGYLAASLTRGNIERSGKLLFNRYPGGKANPMYWIGAVFEATAHVEDATRVAAFVANLRIGKNMEQALEGSMKSMLNYNLITSPVDKALDGVLGFWTFTRRNWPAQIMNMLDNPQQYSLLSRTLGKISNREQLTAEELGAINRYDRESLTLFGQVIDGVRQMTILGFTPQEQANQTLNTIMQFDIHDIAGSLGNAFPGRVAPLAGFWLDFNYGKDSFTQQDAAYNLPAKYTAVIPKSVQKFLNLTPREVPTYKMGEVVGKEIRLYGEPRTIAILRRFPLWSRQLNDISTLIESIKKDKTGKGIVRFTTGVRDGEIDTVKAEKSLGLETKKRLGKLMRKHGAPPPLEIPYLPKEEKKSDAYRELVEETKAKRYRR